MISERRDRLLMDQQTWVKQCTAMWWFGWTCFIGFSWRVERNFKPCLSKAKRDISTFLKSFSLWHHVCARCSAFSLYWLRYVFKDRVWSHGLRAGVFSLCKLVVYVKRPRKDKCASPLRVRVCLCVKESRSGPMCNQGYFVVLVRCRHLRDEVSPALTNGCTDRSGTWTPACHSNENTKIGWLPSATNMPTYLRLSF